MEMEKLGIHTFQIGERAAIARREERAPATG
jgi:hypothetical protein